MRDQESRIDTKVIIGISVRITSIISLAQFPIFRARMYSSMDTLVPKSGVRFVDEISLHFCRELLALHLLKRFTRLGKQNPPSGMNGVAAYSRNRVPQTYEDFYLRTFYQHSW